MTDNEKYLSDQLVQMTGDARQELAERALFDEIRQLVAANRAAEAELIKRLIDLRNTRLPLRLVLDDRLTLPKGFPDE